MDNLDQIIREFTSGVDKGIELEKNLNLFAEEIAAKLIYDLDGEGIIAEYEDIVFSFKFLYRPNLFNKAIYDVKLLDLTDYRKCLKLSIPESAKNIKVATFEHEGQQYTLQQELKSALTLLLFDYFNIPLAAEAEEDLNSLN